MTLLIRQLSSALIFMVGLVLILYWFYSVGSSFSLLFLGLGLLFLGVIGVVTTIAEAEEELE
jgi:hypothetical protein